MKKFGLYSLSINNTVKTSYCTGNVKITTVCIFLNMILPEPTVALFLLVFLKQAKTTAPVVTIRNTPLTVQNGGQ